MKLTTKLGCLFTMLLAFTGTIPLHAQEPSILQDVPEKISEQRNGSITLQLTEPFDDCLSVDGVTFGINQIADVIDGEYRMHEEYQDMDIDLNAITTADELEATAIALTKVMTEAELTMETDETGICTASDLPVGVYLVYPTDLANYELIDPFIVAIPTFNEAEGVMEYDVNVFPKHSPLPRIRIRKTDSSNHRNITGSDFTFMVYSDEDCLKKVDEIQGIAADGIAEYLVHYGSWWIRETKAPEGYVLSSEKIHIEITQDGLFVNGNPVQTDEDHYYTVEFTNKKVTPPNTGTDTHTVFYITAAGASLLMIFSLLIYKAKKK